MEGEVSNVWSKHTDLWMLIMIQLGDEKYAVYATQGPTLCFDPPQNFTRDDVTEKVR